MSERNRYFQKFPLTEYNGIPSTNIVKRVALNEQVRNFITAFYTHTMPTDEKFENVAYDYYGDVNLDWLIYHANDIVDPYYQEPLSYEDFDNFIQIKYGSIRNARQKTIHYKNNYENSDEILSMSAYVSKPAQEKKYWQPVLSQTGIAGYERSTQDFIVSTNRLETFDLTTDSGPFIKNEIIRKNDDEITFAEVASANSTNLILQHIRGDFSANTNYTITGDESGVTATVNANSFQLLQNVIPEGESIYYSPVSFYDYEEELNEKRREIYLVDSSYSRILNEQLEQLLE